MENWRVADIGAVGDGEYAVTLSDGAGRTRSYPFTAKLVGLGDHRILLINGAGGDRDSMWDGDSATAVNKAVSAFHHAAAAGETDQGRPRSVRLPAMEKDWRVVGIAAAAEGDYTVTLTDGPGRTRDYRYTLELAPVGDGQEVLFRPRNTDLNSTLDSTAATAVYRAVAAFHEAARRTVSIGHPKEFLREDALRRAERG